mgnify:CR=1 FL=1
METFNLPVLKKMIINNYDLYTCPLELEFSETLNLIRGTNGTGKSTLLHIILYSIIGPYTYGIKFKNYKNRKKANRPMLKENFFRDRMIQKQEDAEVIVDFDITGQLFKVKRSLYNTELLEFSVDNEVYDKKDYKTITYQRYEKKYSEEDNEELSEIESYLIGVYNQKIAEATNVPDGFNTLVDMFTDTIFFSEDRHYSFWNSDKQQKIIGSYILSSDDYIRYREAVSETQYRQSKYKQRSEALNYANKFLNAEQQGNSEIENIQETKDELENKLSRLDSEQRSINISISKNQTNLIGLKKKYEKFYDEQKRVEEKYYSILFEPDYKKIYSKYINAMKSNRCPFCNSKHEFELDSQNCILCDEKLKSLEKGNLSDLDIERKKISDSIKQIKLEIEKLNNQIETDETRLRILKSQLIETQQKFNKINLVSKDYLGEDKNRLAILENQKEDALMELKSAQQKERELKIIIEQSLSEKFVDFSDQFIKFAKGFFGSNREIELRLPKKSMDDYEEGLIQLILDDVLRDDKMTLSESQRIFVDLSYRFSILCHFHKNSLFLCETPDSSLDLYHEKNAVATLKYYINKGNSLFITSNERSSYLIDGLMDEYGDVVNIIDLTKLSRYRIKETV